MVSRSKKKKLRPVRKYRTVRGVARALSKVALNTRRHKALFNRGLRLAKSYDDIFLLTYGPLSPRQVADIARRSYYFGRDEQTKRLFSAFLLERKK